MTPALVRAAMVLGLFVAIGSAWSLIFVRPGSGEFVIATFGLALGLVVTVMSAVLARRDIRRSLDKEEQ